jgi:NitT/TauT family transport system permease protein
MSTADVATVAEDLSAPLRVHAGRRRALVLSLQALVLVTVLGGWELLARTQTIDPFFYGEPSGIARRIWNWQTNGTIVGPLWQQAWVTIEEALLGFAIGVVLGVSFGVLLGRVRLLADVFGSYIKAANSIPRIVLGAIFILWFGLGMESKVALAVVLVFFVVFFNAFQGVREVDRLLLSNARVLGAGRLQITTQVVLPSALTWIIGACTPASASRSSAPSWASSSAPSTASER